MKPLILYVFGIMCGFVAMSLYRQYRGGRNWRVVCFGSRGNPWIWRSERMKKREAERYFRTRNGALYMERLNQNGNHTPPYYKCDVV